MFGSGQSGGAQQARGLAHAPQTIHQKVLTITDGLGDSLHFDFAIEERVVGGKTVETKGIHSWGIPCTLLANKMIATKHIAILRPYQWFTYAFSAPLNRIQSPTERSTLIRRQLRPTNARQATGHSPQNDAIGGDVVFIRGLSVLDRNCDGLPPSPYLWSTRAANSQSPLPLGAAYLRMLWNTDGIYGVDWPSIRGHSNPIQTRRPVDRGYRASRVRRGGSPCPDRWQRAVESRSGNRADRFDRDPARAPLERRLSRACRRRNHLDIHRARALGRRTVAGGRGDGFSGGSHGNPGRQHPKKCSSPPHGGRGPVYDAVAGIWQLLRLWRVGCF